MDKRASKIAVAEIEKLEQLLDETPAQHVTAVSKREAIVRLAPKLFDLQAKGYSWHEVAVWLTEHGLNVSKSVLGDYLRRARANIRRAAAHHSRPRRQASIPSSGTTSTAHVSESMLEQVPKRPANVAAERSTEQATVRLVRDADGGRRRSEFAVRQDSDEI
jgi:hypothetical protein